MNNQDVLPAIASAARARAARVEVTSEEIERTEVVIRDGVLESSARGRELAVAVRLWHEGHASFVTASGDLDPGALVAKAIALAHALPASRPLPTVSPAVSEAVAPGGTAGGTVTEDLLVDRFRASTDAAAAGLQSEVRCLEERRGVRVLHTAGGDWGYQRTSATLDLRVTARSGGQTGVATGAAHGRDLVRLVESELDPLVRRVGRWSSTLSRAEPVEVSPDRVIFTADVAAELIGILAGTLQLDSVRQQRSRWSGRVGERVCVPQISLVDDARMPSAPLCTPFDDEGVATRSVPLVTNGVLQGFLSDRRTASEAQVEGTGSGWREDGGTPASGTSNLYLLGDPDKAVDVIGESDNCLLVVQTHGMHTANEITGDFSLGGSGAMVSQGRLGRAVKDFTVAGNIHDLLESIDAYGDDLRFVGDSSGGFGSPSLRCHGVTVGR